MIFVFGPMAITVESLMRTPQHPFTTSLRGAFSPPCVIPKTFDPGFQWPVSSPSIHSKCQEELQVQSGRVQPHAPEALIGGKRDALGSCVEEECSAAKGEMGGGEGGQETRPVSIYVADVCEL